jgi:hypothetical protein
MVACIRASILVVSATAACSFPRPDDVGTVGGQVRGLWNGADGVALRLQANGLDTRLTVSANGPFHFPDSLPERSSYSVAVAASPARHECLVDAGANGLITDADVTNVSIICTGPDLGIQLSGPWGWRFDPLEETQIFTASILAQEVALTVSGATLTSVTVNHAPASIGAQTDPIALPLGTITVPVEVVASGGLSRLYQFEFERGSSVVDQIVYGKAPNPGVHSNFGVSIALSGDTLAVGSYGESSRSTGVNGDQTDISAPNSGAVYVFVRRESTWTQQAYIKASNTDTNDLFGTSVALSGHTLAVGAVGEASNARQINGSQVDNNADGAGAVYVFVRNASTWTQQAYIKPTDTGVGHRFGLSLALSSDTLAVSGNRSNLQDGQNVDGAVYVFVRDGTTWTQQGILTPPSVAAPNVGVFFLNVALSADTLVVPGQEMNVENGHIGRGVTYVFTRNAATWTQQADLTTSTDGTLATLDHFSSTVALSGDRLAVSAPLRDEGALTRIVRIFERSGERPGSEWTHRAEVTGSNTVADDAFGTALALSGDLLAVGASKEDGKATGVNGDQGDGATSAGAVYLFSRSDTGWRQSAYIKASNTGMGDGFGISVALSGNSLAAGAHLEASDAVGINPASGQSDDSMMGAGAIYVFR